MGSGFRIWWARGLLSQLDCNGTEQSSFAYDAFGRKVEWIEANWTEKEPGQGLVTGSRVELEGGG